MRFHGAHADKDGLALVRAAIAEFGRELALVSSFGAEAAVLLDMVARVDPATPVIFLDTGMLFEETLAYAQVIEDRFGLRNLRRVRPPAAVTAREDADGELWDRDPERCCHIRKVAPLEKALSGFAAWMSGIKRYHNFVRADVETIELVDGRVKISPLARFEPEAIRRAFEERELPRNPLVAQGYPSIGCVPCTSPVTVGEDPRAGRWAGREKTECGIHRPIFGEPS